MRVTAMARQRSQGLLQAVTLLRDRRNGCGALLPFELMEDLGVPEHNQQSVGDVIDEGR